MGHFKVILVLLCFYSVASSQELDTLKTSNPTLVYHSKELYVPASLLLSGAILNTKKNRSFRFKVKEWRNKNMYHFRTRIDDFLQFAPLVSVYAFHEIGMSHQTEMEDLNKIALKSQVLMLGTVYILKTTTKNIRPNGAKHSFPSGHTAEAFAGATLLSIEYGKDYKWVPYVAYGTAGLVGAFRIANNRHYISDVLFGAGLGILSTKIAYWTHHYKPTINKKEDDPFELIYEKQNFKTTP